MQELTNFTLFLVHNIRFGLCMFFENLPNETEIIFIPVLWFLNEIIIYSQLW